MKKICNVLLCFVLLFALAVPAFAAELSVLSAEFSDITLPVAGEKVGDVIHADAKVVLSEDGKRQPEKKFSATATWREAGKKDALKKTDSFVAGRTYRLTVEIEFMEATEVKEDESQFFINGKEAKLDGTKGNTVSFYGDFVATPGNFAPKVSLEVEGGEKTKEYDGKGIVLTARVQKIEGVDYRYEWYRDGEKLTAEKAESVTVKNVADSGEYHCTVIASLATDSSVPEKSTTSASSKIKITPRVVTVQIEDAEKNLFDPDPEFSFEVLGEVFDELEGELSRMEGEDLGKYSILIGTLAFPEEVAENYELRVEQGTLTILDVGALPFEAVKNLADQSYIVGKNGAKIRVSATRGAIPENAILSLSLPSGDAKKAVESQFDQKVLKSFSVSLLDETGKKLSLSRHATIKIQIPLSEEEGVFDPETIKAAFYANSPSELKTEVVKSGDVTYLVVSVEKLGSVLLLEGQKEEKKADSEPKADSEKKSGFAWMWILIALVSLLSVGAVVFTVWWTKKNKASSPEKEKEMPKKPAEKAPEKKEKLLPQKEKEAEVAQEKAEKEAAEAAEDKKEKTIAVPKTISFEDLED